MKSPLLMAVLLCLIPACGLAEETYTFDSSEIEKKPYHLGAYLEAKPVIYWLDKDSSLYKLKYYNQDLGKTLEELNFKVQLEGSFEKEALRFYFKTNTDIRYSEPDDSEQSTFYEAYGSLKPSPSLKIDVGKKTLKWGKGYAWNPVAFVDRPKDPDDPEQSLEGFVVVSADYVKSFSGPLKTLSFTPVLIPVTDEINSNFGESSHLNLAGKVYFLLFDTDIDLLFLTGGSRTTRYGIDFSRNVTTNLEVHGEFAYINDFKETYIDGNGTVFTDEYDALSLLVGLRYLTARDTTYILEYYHNGTGYGPDQMRDFFSYVNSAYNTYLSTGSDAPLKRGQSLLENSYGRINPMQNYIYLRVIQKEPFDILYLSPALTLIMNLDDGSFNLSPEIVYTRVTNLELRLKFSFIVGDTNSEFGEKQNDYRLEFRAGYYF